MWRKIVLTALTAGLVLSCAKEETPTGTPIDNTPVSFEGNTEFEAFCISEYDRDGDGSLSVYEAGLVRDLDCSGLGLKSIKGIKNFTNLEALYCHDNMISTIDVSGMAALKYLYCNNAAVYYLDVTGCSSLLMLDAHQNNLKSIDITGSPQLFMLSICFNANISELDLSNSAGMTLIYCQSCRLEKLDLSSCPLIEGLHCWGNRLAELNLSGCGRLTDLWCGDNNLKSLDICCCPDRMEYVSCPRNYLMTILYKREAQQITSLELPPYASVRIK